MVVHVHAKINQFRTEILHVFQLQDIFILEETHAVTILPSFMRVVALSLHVLHAGNILHFIS